MGRVSRFVLCAVVFAALVGVALAAPAAKGKSKGPDMAKYNARVGKKYLEENGKKEGVTTTASGLQYKVLKAGSGKYKPTKSDTVEVHYRGTLLNGKEFDSSYKRGQPASFGVGQVIAGWTEALQLMTVGDEWELTIPSEIAYGKSGTGRDIGPNAVLIFKVELLGVKGKKKEDL